MNSEDILRATRLIQKTELAGCSPLAFREHIEKLWDAGLPPGESSGWPSVDKHYTVVPGQLTVVTGWPGSGKSEWLDAVLLNLAKRGWRFCIFSPENQPSEIHVVKYLEKFLCKPFGSGPNPRMSKDEATEAATEIDAWFKFLVPAANSDRLNFGVNEILESCEAEFRMSGYWPKSTNKGLVIDPWNELEHLRPPQLSETEYISMTLSRVRAWARAHNVHVWIVAHPQKLRRDEGGKLPIPKPDSISGSQHWWNKADNAITVWREFDDHNKQEVQIHIQKVRFKHVGRPGVVTLLYDRVTGRYNEQLRSVAPRSYADI